MRLSVFTSGTLVLLLAAPCAMAVPASVTPGKTPLMCNGDGAFQATWSGVCKDGFAEGSGVATWTEGKQKVRVKGELARGDARDTITMQGPGMTYIGTVEHFIPHGQGFVKSDTGDMYEGGIDHGKPSGPGIRQNLDRSRYEGEWVDGVREGEGQATFTLGGSYAGHWHNGLFDGPGTIVYAGSGRTYTGQFKAGRAVDGPAPVAAATGSYRISRSDTPIGSSIPEAVSNNSPLSGERWSEMSDGQRETFKNPYLALAPGDEPPYPVNGLRRLVEAISTMHGALDDHYGLVRMYVLVGADGKAKSATAIGKVREDVATFVGRALMLTQYKSAVCDGKPCEMIFPIAFYLE